MSFLYPKFKKGEQFYAKNKVSKRYFYPYDGFSHGLSHDLLQHFPEHRWNEQPGISHGFRRNEDYVAGCICTGVLYC